MSEQSCGLKRQGGGGSVGVVLWPEEAGSLVARECEEEGFVTIVRIYEVERD